MFTKWVCENLSLKVVSDKYYEPTKVSDIKLGDKLLDFNNEQVQITSILETEYTGKSYTIEFTDFSSKNPTQFITNENNTQKLAFMMHPSLISKNNLKVPCCNEIDILLHKEKINFQSCIHFPCFEFHDILIYEDYTRILALVESLNYIEISYPIKNLVENWEIPQFSNNLRIIKSNTKEKSITQADPLLNSISLYIGYWLGDGFKRSTGLITVDPRELNEHLLEMLDFINAHINKINKQNFCHIFNQSYIKQFLPNPGEISQLELKVKVLEPRDNVMSNGSIVHGQLPLSLFWFVKANNGNRLSSKNFLLEEMKKLNLLYEKYRGIPSQIFKSSDEVKKKVVAGLILSDGYLNKGCDSYGLCQSTFEHSNIVEDLQKILEGLDINTRGIFESNNVFGSITKKLNFDDNENIFQEYLFYERKKRISSTKTINRDRTKQRLKIFTIHEVDSSKMKFRKITTDKPFIQLANSAPL